ncbi:MAG TPA: DUF3800 domain-containing protein [Methanocorpusculum sp.]|nr:DUF3800 domain-containing protein [Methanocorpusculum sp.]
MYVCIDESGDLGKYPPSPSPWFVLAAILTDSKHELDSIITRIRKKEKSAKHTLPGEIKYRNSSAELKNKVLKSICSKNCTFAAITAKKIPAPQKEQPYRRETYYHLLFTLLTTIIEKYPDEENWIIHIDRGTASYFQERLQVGICEYAGAIHSGNPVKIQIEIVDSLKSEPVQAADFIAGCIYSHYQNPGADNEIWSEVEDKLEITALQKTYV